MDYEKKYKEALERARQLCAYPTTKPFISDLKDLFPELKESEDERIRKELIDFVKSRLAGFPDCKRFTDWLEKQGEQKLPIEKLPEEMKTIVESLGFTTQEECDRYNQMVSDLIMSDDDKGEQNSAWSEEDASLCVRIQGILSVCKNHSLLSPYLCKEMCDWLKFLKDRVQPQPQPKQEWSEEDENILQGIWDEILANKHDAKEYEWKTYDKFLNWLKYLKPQSHSWKPTEEQMDALNDVISSRDIKYDVLSELWKDLKKLKE